jgi:hypothetical protein
MKYQFTYHKHETVFVDIVDVYGNCVFHGEAPGLSEIESLLAERGASRAFDDYLEFENFLWEIHEDELLQIDEDTSFEDDHDHPAQYKQGMAKWRVETAFAETIKFYRDDMIRSYSKETAASENECLGRTESR